MLDLPHVAFFGAEAKYLFGQSVVCMRGTQKVFLSCVNARDVSHVPAL
jgi:hypothetical protein